MGCYKRYNIGLTNTNNMIKAINKIEHSYKVEQELFIQLDIVKTGHFWNGGLVTSSERTAEMLRIKDLQKANLSERFNLLDNLELELLKAKQDTSTKQRNINL